MQKDFLEEENKLEKTKQFLKEEIKEVSSILETENSDNEYLKAYLIYLFNKRVKDIKSIIDKPYFARVDFKEENSLEEKLYIGKISIMDSKTNTPVIIDWRSKIANLYYEWRLRKS